MKQTCYHICFACALLTCASAQTVYRTLIDKEPGSIFQQANGFPVTDYGFVDGSILGLDPAAIRGEMVHFAAFDTSEETQSLGFPYSKLKAYEAQQVSQGLAPIFVTATYAGKKRPVYFSWSLVLVNNKPTAPANEWQYAVNFQDPRFIRFWLSQYIQPLVSKYQLRTDVGPNIWFHIDQGSYEYALYGVLDDNNNFVPGVTWDSPFPQNQANFETAVETFYSQIKALAPDVSVIVNSGGQSDPTHFPALFANVGGAMLEDLYAWRSSATTYNRNLWYENNFQYFSWLASQNRAMALRALIPSSDTEGLITSFALYSLLKSQNAFFAPGDTESLNLSPSTWSGWAAQLGKPTGTLQASAAGSEGDGYRLFSRTYEGGIVYLNGTGQTATIALNPAVTYYDPNGYPLTSHSIQLADVTGTYVTTLPLALPKPRISPRYASPAMGPLPVTIQSDTAGTTIRYTLDGSTPTTSSTLYSGPISLKNTAVVSARAFLGSQSSFTAVAQYTISTTPLTTQTLLTSDTGPAGSYYPVVTLSAIPLEPVSVFYIVQNGTPASGQYTFPPGMASGVFPVTSGASGTTTITLTGANGASVGTNRTLTYTIGSTGSSTTVGQPSLVSLTPSSGTGLTQKFQMAYNDPNGASQLTLAGVIIGPYLTIGKVCYAYYKPSANAIYLENDAGDTLLGPIAPGSSSQLSNSQCTISGSGSSASLSGSSLVLTLNITFKSTFTGTKTIYMRALESATVATPWVAEGTWTP